MRDANTFAMKDSELRAAIEAAVIAPLPEETYRLSGIDFYLIAVQVDEAEACTCVTNCAGAGFLKEKGSSRRVFQDVTPFLESCRNVVACLDVPLVALGDEAFGDFGFLAACGHADCCEYRQEKRCSYVSEVHCGRYGISSGEVSAADNYIIGSNEPTTGIMDSRSSAALRSA